MRAVRIGVLDDHRAFGEAISKALSGFEGIEPIGLVHSIDSAVDLVRERRPEVLLVDYQLINGTGFDCADRLAEAGLEVRLVMLTAYASPDVVQRALDRGFERVLSKETPLNEIADAVRIPALGTGTCVPGGTAHLSRRQREVLELMGQGLDPASIADELFISVHTSRSHVKDVLRIMGASTQLAAVTKAIRDGYLLPPARSYRRRESPTDDQLPGDPISGEPVPSGAGFGRP